MFTEFDNAFKEVDKMFTQLSYVLEGNLGTPVDVAHDTGDGYSFTLNAAGFKKEELDITVQGRTVTVKGTSAKTKRKLDTYFTAPKAIDMHRAEAKLEDGLLEVIVFKLTTPDGAKVTIK